MIRRPRCILWSWTRTRSDRETQEGKSLSPMSQDHARRPPRLASAEIHGLPRIENLDDLANVTGIGRAPLRWMLYGRHHYTTFQIPKRHGGFRAIARPKPALAALQRWILRSILDRLHSAPGCCGFERGSKLIDNATPHTGAKAILCLDIEGFFPSISAARVATVFRIAGYRTDVASMMAQFCTRDGVLPQGAPSSPKLANLVCFRLDRRLRQFAEKSGFVYSRYADDMTFSGPSSSRLAKALPMLEHIVNSTGFAVNRGKTRLLGGGRALRVTGLVVSPHSVGIGRRKVRELRVRLHRLRTKSDCVSTDLPSLQGWLDYVSDVDQPRYCSLVRYIEALRRTSSISCLAALRTRKAL